MPVYHPFFFRTIVIACFIGVVDLQAQSLQRLQDTSFAREPGLRIEPGLSYTLGTSAKEFFKHYQTVLGGKSSEFEIPVSGTLRISRHLNNYVSVGIVSGYQRTILRENYNYDPATFPVGYAPFQNITQNFTMESIPVLLCADYYPVNRQFTTYVGLGLGLCFSHGSWFEQISTSRMPGARIGGSRYEGWVTHGAMQMRTGISFGFDATDRAPVKSGIRLECSYWKLPIQASFMESIAKTFTTTVPESMRQPFTIDVGGLAFHIGIMFVLRHPTGNQRTP